MTRRFSLAFVIVCTLAHVGTARAGIVLYATSYYSNSVYAVNSDGTTSVFTTPVAHASGIAVSASGDVYAASETDNTILKFSSTGTLIGTFATEHLSTPVGLAFDSSGNLYVANDTGSITEYSSSGTYLKTFASGLSAPIGLAIDKSGNVYVSDGAPGGRITKYDSTGAVLNTVSGGFNYPGQLTFDSAGNVYTSNAAGDTITKFTSSLANLGTFATGTGANDYGVVYDSLTNSFYQGTFGPSANPNGAIQHFDANGNSLGYVALDQGTAFFLAVPPLAVPEPATITLMALGLAGAACFARRRKRSLLLSPPESQ